MFNLKWKQVDLVSDYQSLFSTEIGQRVLYDLMKKGHFLHSSYTGKGSEDCIFREGERNIVNYILLMLKQDIDQIKQNIERQEEQESDYV